MDREELEKLTTEQLREEFSKGLKITVEHLTRLALVLDVLESRGEKLDLAKVPAGLPKILRAVAKGTLLAEIVVGYCGSPDLLRRIACLPVRRQQQLLDGELSPEEFRKKRGRKRQDIEEEKEFRNPLLTTAEVASPRDLAEMIVELVLRHESSLLVWDLVNRDNRLLSLLGRKRLVG